jgi:hypothetical protein
VRFFNAPLRRTKSLKLHPAPNPNSGNAQTRKNSNSSRFTKVLQLTTGGGGGMEGGCVRVMLLEAHRVVAQGEGERGFHVLHALLASPLGAAAPSGRALALSPPPAAGWRFLGAPPAAGDAGKWRAIEKVLAELGVPAATSAGWWAALAACLHLGQVELAPAEDGGGGAALGAGGGAGALAALLGSDHAALAAALTTRSLRVRGEALAAARSVAGAAAAASSLAKGIYRAVFDAVAALCGGATASGGAGAPKAPGAPAPPRAVLLVDVFGFEVPAEVNGFDALCINAANSALHDLYTRVALAEEQAFFAAEGLPWSPISLESEAPVLAALWGPGVCLFKALDDEQLVGAAAGDDGAAAALEATLRAAVAPRSEVHGALAFGDAAGVFSVRHYAGVVVYAVEQLVFDNVDTMDSTLRAFLGARDPAAPAGWLAAAFSPPPPPPPPPLHPARAAPRAPAPPPSALSAPSLGAALRCSLDSLTRLLRDSRVQWVRCIRPNDEKAAFSPNAALVGAQVAALGLPAAVRIARNGFAARFSFAAFCGRFTVLSGATWPPRSAAQRAGGRGGAAALLAALRLPPPVPAGDSPARAAALWALRLTPPRRLPCDVGAPLAPDATALGATCVFIKDGATLHALEFCRAAALSVAASVVGAAWRGHVARAARARAVRAAVRLQAAWRRACAARAWGALTCAAARVGAWARGCLARGRARDARAALGLLRGAGGKPRSVASVRWSASGTTDWAGVLGAPPRALAPAALARRLAHPAELLFSAPVLKLRLGAWEPVPRLVALVGGARPALLSFAHGAGSPASEVPLAAVSALWLSRARDNLIGILCGAEGARRKHPLLLITPLKQLLATYGRAPHVESMPTHASPPHTHTYTHTTHTHTHTHTHTGHSLLPNAPTRYPSCAPISWR